MALITALLVLHWIGDFRLQSNWMAFNKSKWNTSVEGMYAILAHVAAYTLTIAVGVAPLVLLGALPTLNPWSWVGFLLVTFGCHLATDALTSKMTTAQWFVKARSGMTQIGALSDGSPIMGFRTWLDFDMKKRSNFFNIIGFDQTLHYLALFWAAWAIGAL